MKVDTQFWSNSWIRDIETCHRIWPPHHSWQRRNAVSFGGSNPVMDPTTMWEMFVTWNQAYHFRCKKSWRCKKKVMQVKVTSSAAEEWRKQTVELLSCNVASGQSLCATKQFRTCRAGFQHSNLQQYESKFSLYGCSHIKVSQEGNAKAAFFASACQTNQHVAKHRHLLVLLAPPENLLISAVFCQTCAQNIL